MANAPAASAGRPSCEHESDDDEEAVQTTAPERDPGNCVEPGNASHYGQFTWTVALPAAPADKDSLADISKIRQFRWAAQLCMSARCVCAEVVASLRRATGPTGPRAIGIFARRFALRSGGCLTFAIAGCHLTRKLGLH